MTGENIDDLERLKKAAKLILKNEASQLALAPSIATRLLNLASDDSASFEDLSRLIETEPALTAKILQIVNSAAFALRKPVSSIHRAVHLLGFSAVRRTALTLIFFNKLIKQDGNQSFDPLFFWLHCLFVASLSRRIAIARGLSDPDQLYTAGLLHDIGKVLLESYGHRTYSDFISSLKGSCHSMLDEERRFFGITHAEIGHLLCMEWQLPSPIVAVAAHHHHHSSAKSPYLEFDQEIAIVSFSDYIAWIHGIASFKTECQPVLPQWVLRTIDLGQLDLENLLQLVDQEMLSIREHFGIQFPDLNSLRATLVQTSIALGQNALEQFPVSASKAGRDYPSSLTTPHQSLDPDHFVPMTLEAIRNDFKLDRAILFTIDRIRRRLVSSYRQPPMTSIMCERIEIPIEASSGILLRSLREKRPILISAANEPNNPIIKRLNVNELITVPIHHQNRLIGLIVADNSVTRTWMSQHLLSEISPVAHQLGIALVNAQQYDNEKKRAQMDSLTQLLNKRALDQSLAKIFKQDRSILEKIAVGFVDIDKFKLFNDTCGHQAGDKIIRIVAEHLAKLTRPEDIIGRYGGEEFLFILNNADRDGAISYAERIRTGIERIGKALSSKFNGLALTVSIGISMYHPEFSNYTDMIEIADQAMYRAKNEGRNRVILLADLNRTKVY